LVYLSRKKKTTKYYVHNLPKSVNKIYDGKEKIIDAVDQLLDNNFKTYENPLGFEHDSLN